MTVRLSPEVERALAQGAPVVALETTIICHGLPRPRNLATGRSLEAIVREAGAVPATIAILDDAVHVGLTDEELVRLAEADDVVKCSTRDIALTLARGRLGATTVAATIALAARAGIRFMATGGLGGVHRGGEDSLDISADLLELQRSPVCLVCSGAKVILDLPRTMEQLETFGIGVIGFGTDELPAFYCRESGLAVERVDDIGILAAALVHQAALGWPGSIVVTNPPPPALAMRPDVVERLVADAVAAARREGAIGKRETPFVLAHMAKASHGATVDVNVALVESNALLAARIAVATARMERR